MLIITIISLSFDIIIISTSSPPLTYMLLHQITMTNLSNHQGYVDRFIIIFISSFYKMVRERLVFSIPLYMRGLYRS